jgi:hypothetical protein
VSAGRRLRSPSARKKGASHITCCACHYLCGEAANLQTPHASSSHPQPPELRPLTRHSDPVANRRDAIYAVPLAPEWRPIPQVQISDMISDKWKLPLQQAAISTPQKQQPRHEAPCPAEGLRCQVPRCARRAMKICAGQSVNICRTYMKICAGLWPAQIITYFQPFTLCPVHLFTYFRT